VYSVKKGPQWMPESPDCPAIELVRDHMEIRPLPMDPIKALRGMFKGYSGSLAADLVKDRREEARRDEDGSPPKARL
jgi:hypothetical protein